MKLTETITSTREVTALFLVVYTTDECYCRYTPDKIFTSLEDAKDYILKESKKYPYYIDYQIYVQDLQQPHLPLEKIEHSFEEDLSCFLRPKQHQAR